jgi:hypothetical protein
MLAFLLFGWHFLRSTWDTVRDPSIRPLAIWLAVLLGGGTIFYRHAEGWTWLDSLYFCVITLATVGFGDITPVTNLGKAFTIVYVLAGIGVLVAVVSAVAQRATTRFEEQRRAVSDRAAKHLGGGKGANAGWRASLSNRTGAARGRLPRRPDR